MAYESVVRSRGVEVSRSVGSPPEIPGFSYVEHLGSGGYSDVYLYEQHQPRMKVAVEVLTDEASRIRRGASSWPKHVFRADVTADDRPFLAMKYYPNKNLSVRAREERFAVLDVLRIGVQISDAVETAHRAGILHRDIKPANILTGHFGATGLADLGSQSPRALEDSNGMSVPWAPPEVIFATSEPMNGRMPIRSVHIVALVGRSLAVHAFGRGQQPKCAEHPNPGMGAA
jgi:serine/threonine protein kinase